LGYSAKKRQDDRVPLIENSSMKKLLIGYDGSISAKKALLDLESARFLLQSRRLFSLWPMSAFNRSQRFQALRPHLEAPRTFQTHRI
jgi:hypothetical protein